MGLRDSAFDWIEPVERWLHRAYLVVWVLGVVASAATIAAGHLQSIPPYWVMPAALAAAILPFFLANQIAVWRRRWHDRTTARAVQSPRPFPIRTLVVVIVLLLIVVASSAPSLIHGVVPSTSGSSSTSVSVFHPLGIAAGLPIIDDIQTKTNGMAMFEGFKVIITGPPETAYVQTALKLLLQHGIKNIEFAELPNAYINLDAPRFPEPQFSGIILHGDDALTRSMFALVGCFKVQTTRELLPGLEEYYHTKKLVWIEIGKGSPWHTPQVCSG